jgi:hypothetical protein
MLDLPEFAKNSGKAAKKAEKKSTKKAPKKHGPGEGKTSTETLAPKKKKVNSFMKKEDDLDMWDSIVDAVADDHDFMQEELSEGSFVDELNKAPKKSALAQKSKKVHKAKKHSKKEAKTTEKSFTQLKLEQTKAPKAVVK